MFTLQPNAQWPHRSVLNSIPFHIANFVVFVVHDYRKVGIKLLREMVSVEINISKTFMSFIHLHILT